MLGSRVRTISLGALASVSLIALAACGGGGGGGGSKPRSLVPRATQPQPSLALKTAEWDDADASGDVSAGDLLLLEFSEDLVFGAGASAPDAARDLALPVSGDSLGQGVALARIASNPRLLVVLLGSGAMLTEPGVFDAAQAAAGSPSGIAIAPTRLPGAIRNAAGEDVAIGPAVDIARAPPAPPPAGRPEVYAADFVDQDGDGRVSRGDLIDVLFSKPVVLGTGAQAPAAADWSLPVQGDSLGAGPTFRAGRTPERVEIVLGAQPLLTIDGTFSTSRTTASSPSGLDVSPSIAPGAIADASGQDADATGAVDIDGQTTGGGTTQPGPGRIAKAEFKDLNSDGRIDSGDVLILTFSEPILLGGTLDPAADFVLPVQGDTLGSARIQQGLSGYDLEISLARDTVLNPNGAFAAAQVAPGSPSGIDIRAGIPTSELSDQQGRALQGGAPIDLDGQLIPPPPPAIEGATVVDADVSGTVGQGDELHLRFSEPVTLGSGTNAPKPQDFFLPVSGDTLGTDAKFRLASGDGTPSDRIIITLGTGAILTAPGTFTATATSAGSPSAIDIATGLVTTRTSSIVSARGVDARAAAQRVDVAEPRGAVAETFADQGRLDPTNASAEWGAGGSGVLAGSLAAVDVRQGQPDLIISTAGKLDTEAGTLDGQPLDGFTGGGVFEVRRFEVGKGVQVEVTGRYPLQVFASADALVAGDLTLDGKKGGDQTAFGTNTPGSGGAPGAGGFAGGDGGRGGQEPAKPGKGPAAGRGGFSDNTPGGGGGAGFASAGKDGETVAGAWATPVGQGGAAGAQRADLDLVPFRGGAGGGGGGGDDDEEGGWNGPLGTVDPEDEAGAGGGGGGGAFRLAAALDVVVSGKIGARGGNGGKGSSAGAAGGGAGAGGAILIQSAGKLRLSPSATLIALGGKGGTGEAEGGDGSDGVILLEDQDGAIDQDQALVTGTVYPMWAEARAGALGAPPATIDLLVSQDATIDTDTGAIDGAVSPAFDAQAGRFDFKDVTIAAGARLRARGSRPLHVAAAGTVTIDGTLDLSGEPGEGSRGGLGGRGGRGVAGGGNGGDGGTVVASGGALASEHQPKPGEGPGAGTAGPNGRSAVGGGGGSYGTAGGSGSGARAGQAGPTYGGDALDPLEGGSGAGGGSATNESSFTGGGGGGAGGGAVKIECANDIAVSGTIDANGGNGGPSSAAPGGAGSGGAIFLKAEGRLRIAGRVTAAGGYAPSRGGFGGDGRIRLEDSVGEFGMGKIEPQRRDASFATSFAQSAWYPVVDAAGAAVLDARFIAVVTKMSVPPATAVAIEVEGAKADQAGNPDLTKATGFTTDLEALKDAHFIRFRVTLRADRASAAAPAIDELRLPFE